MKSKNTNKMTPVQEILKWMKENSFNVEGRSLDVKKAVYVDEFKNNMGKWLTDERLCMWNFYEHGHNDTNEEPSMSLFYDNYDKLHNAQ